jgi:hypothetical protein
MRSGLTILLMFAVHYSNRYSWGVNLAPVFRHNHYYLSVGDLAFPWFHFAVGFALRLTLLRRLETQGAWAAYGRVVRRCVLLILLGDVGAQVGGLHVSRWGAELGGLCKDRRRLNECGAEGINKKCPPNSIESRSHIIQFEQVADTTSAPSS